MKQIRHLAFLLSLIVMTGHDMVPHIHADEDALPEYSATLPPSSNGVLDDLPALFAHFQHSAGERNLVYLQAAGKNATSQVKIAYHLPFLLPAADGTGRYADYKKQRFREYPPLRSSYHLRYFALRGPPSC